MVKAVVWGGMLIMILGGMFFGMQALNADTGELVGYAVGAPDANNKCDLQVVVSTMMNAIDPPLQTVSPTSTRPDWPLWASTHLILLDDAGQQLDFRRGGFKSKDISETQFGSSEVILHAELDAGKTYTLTYVPVVGQPEKYTQTIEGAAKEFRRETFDPDY